MKTRAARRDRSGPMKTRAASRTVAILAVPGVQLLDVSGPLDVFAEANVQLGREVYRLIVIASERGDIRSSSGTRIVADRLIRKR
jgi:transcriptional regulator GlxA family with amidase domain